MSIVEDEQRRIPFTSWYGLLESEVSAGKPYIVNQTTTHGSTPVAKPPARLEEKRKQRLRTAA